MRFIGSWCWKLDLLCKCNYTLISANGIELAQTISMFRTMLQSRLSVRESSCLFNSS